MSVFESISSGIRNHFEKRKQEQEFMDNLRREAEAQRLIMFEQEFKRDALEVARATAKKDAAKLSGLQKLRAENRARRLTEPGNQGTFFSKLSEYTQKNTARRDENIKRTEALRTTAKQMNEKSLSEKQKLRHHRLATGKKSFNNSTWKS